MATYILLSRLTEEGMTALKSQPDRLSEMRREVESLGACVLQQYATLGVYDFVSIVEAPDLKTIARVSVDLSARGSMKIQTLSAIPIEEFIAGLD